MKCCGGFICSQCVWKVQELTFGVFLHFNSLRKYSQTSSQQVWRSTATEPEHSSTSLYSLHFNLTVDYKRS